MVLATRQSVNFGTVPFLAKSESSFRPPAEERFSGGGGIPVERGPHQGEDKADAMVADDAACKAAQGALHAGRTREALTLFTKVRVCATNMRLAGTSHVRAPAWCPSGLPRRVHT
jgi:hypothetical protein